ncbi:MAG: phosphoribosylformylglycinamidine synthase subunit PurL [Armatimonadetes bacterium]|nr:phosphoribosylformylglycinamidine synthase subunit PurL [Armatimonadota bacterium]
MPLEVTGPEVHREMGLSDAEGEMIRRRLGREPTLTELGMFAVLWSEHCSYKSSKNVLKYFTRYREAVEGEGLENAGVVDIGDGIGITFKVESHNHPSAVEPYEGAATGIGGIIRDVLSMGARPIACLDSLRFGDITDPENGEDRRLFTRVVQGIGGYGNCIGVPTVAGEVSFHPRFAGNPIVNVMCVGEVALGKVATAEAKGPGNPVLYLGSETGKDGIHGATFASEVLGEESEAKRPNVQIGDPFAGKLLIEATLEALETGAIIAIQDMGAAGLTCSTCEMSVRGGVGMEIDLDRVPLRDPTMNAYEIMLSESQERMLAVVQKGREEEVLAVFKKWGLPAVVIGSVTDDGIVTVVHKGETEASVPAGLISEGCPVLDLHAEKPGNVDSAARFDVSVLPEPSNYERTLLKLLSSPSIASKAWVYQQYDYTVQTRTSLWPGDGDAAVLALRGSQKGIAMKIDGNSCYAYADPFVGGQLALIEAARNVACTGARPVAATDCLNFGDPNDPNVFWRFREAVRGIASASDALNVPILSGNVSFYNETPDGEVLPTPTIGVVGVLDDASKRLGMGFPKGMGYIYLVYGFGHAAKQHALGASEYLRVQHGVDDGAPQPPDLETEKGLLEFLAAAAQESLLECAHDLSDGGFAVALAEMCVVGEAGCFALMDADEHFQRHILGPVLDRMATTRTPPSEAVRRSILDAETQTNPWTYSTRTDARLFGEMPGRVLIGVSSETVRESRLETLRDLAHDRGLFLHCVGTYDAASRHMQIAAPSRSLLRTALKDVREAYFGSIPAFTDGADPPVDA